jgi:hypothetical protein
MRVIFDNGQVLDIPETALASLTLWSTCQKCGHVQVESFERRPEFANAAAEALEP